MTTEDKLMTLRIVRAKLTDANNIIFEAGSLFDSAVTPTNNFYADRYNLAITRYRVEDTIRQLKQEIRTMEIL